MAEYIERNAAFREIGKLELTALVKNRVLHSLLAVPAADVAPVVHERWIKRKSWDYFVCSACSYEQNAPSNYCPNCGANMNWEVGG